MISEPAIVYRANGRRWFTLDAACRAHGRALLAAWFKQAKSELQTVPADLMERYWRAVGYLASRTKRRWMADRKAEIRSARSPARAPSAPALREVR